MKIIKAAIVILALAASTLATAAQVKQETVCKKVEEVARIVMDIRQKNPSVTLSSLMASMQLNDLSSSADKRIKDLILDAYSESNPSYSIKSYQQDAINTFVNKWSAKCWKNNWG
jgi:DNA integrity scanning protein DisA with diadenylate cyclase activity